MTDDDMMIIKLCLNHTWMDWQAQLDRINRKARGTWQDEPACPALVKAIGMIKAVLAKFPPDENDKPDEPADI